jgi:hypothetical protein
MLGPDGERHEPDLDHVLKTILFTHIVGSTERAAELGDRRWRDLLYRHDTVRDLVAGSGIEFTDRASTHSRASQVSGGSSRRMPDAAGTKRIHVNAEMR